ncbi:uncharacterized protein LOC135848292 isoform X2 [Planococcus citri]|uniref:uncharacterized protein LOC135848292 isoform X2 n=1 Tax=Planococcus citri TaxID=170843 RepID=UPI0031F7BFFD
MKSFLLVNKLIIFMLCYWSQIPGALCLRNVIISMPDAVERDEKVRLICRYNLEGETLYTLKWYKGEQEFYRFTPKESPPIKIFKVKGYTELEVVREESNGEQVTLKRAVRSISGRYSCEVTTDSPSFHAVSGHAELRVVVLPKEIPYIKVNAPKIKEGDWANVTCTSNASIPAANLTWTINNKAVTGKARIIHSQRVLDENDQEEAFSSISFQVDESHFKENNSLKVRCTASIYSIYQKTNEIGILLDRPNKAIYKPQVQREPTMITVLPSVKLSRSNIQLDKVYNDNNANNVIQSGNLENTNKSSTLTLGTFYIMLITLSMTLLC